jgi:hypothetical protein
VERLMGALAAGTAERNPRLDQRRSGSASEARPG